jgi:hypothetical protein
VGQVLNTKQLCLQKMLKLRKCAAYSCKSINMDENEFPHSRLITQFVARVTRQVRLMELERAYISVEPEFIPDF